MRTFITFFVCFFAFVLIAGDVSALYQEAKDNTSDQPQATRLIVKFDSSLVSQFVSDRKNRTKVGLMSIDALNAKYDVVSISPLFDRVGSPASSRHFKDIYIVDLKTSDNLSELMSEYKNLPGVEYAEPDYRVELYEIPDDSLFGFQWSLNNTGQEHYHVVRNWGNYNDELVMVNGTTDADIDAAEVYENPPDQTNTVVVAIIDTGVDIDHPDLIENIWTNPREIADNGVDDDNNGYIDDVHGWDLAGSIDPDDPGDNDPTDRHGHGTHCAGIVAATAGNAIGISGVNPEARIMPLNFDPLPLISRIAEGIVYAVDNGADVINMSFGMIFRSGLVDEVIAYADAKGVVLCAASGNSGAEEVNYPAGYDVTIAVGASNDSDRVTSFSTYGDHISVVAPGLSILSLRADLTDMYASGYPREPGVHIVDTIYYMASGTSMACPHVVGAASWIRSVSPGLIPARVKEIIEQSADDIVDPFGVGWNLPGFDKYSGYGRLNLNKALEITPRRRAKIVFPANNAIDSGLILVHGFADGDDFTNWSLDYGMGDNPTSWSNLTSGTQPITNNDFILWDTRGLTGQYTLRLTVDDENIAFATLYIAHEVVAEIITPSNGETISNFASVRGDAYCPDFSSYKLEYLADSSGAEWEQLAGGTVPIFDDILGGWFLEEMSEIDYSLRLSVFAGGFRVNSDSILVTVQSIFSTKLAWRTHLDGYPGIISNYGDFDGDGHNEIIIGTSSGIEVLNTDGTIKLDGIPDFPANNFLMPIAVGNLDGDNIDDIVAVGYDPPFVYGFPSSAPPFRAYTGVFPQLYNFYRTEHEFPKLALKDIDGDGLDEIYLFMFGSSLSSTFLFESDGTLINSFDYFAETFLVDLDGDGTDELYATNQAFSMLRQIDYRTGITTDSLLIQKNGADFRCLGMSAYDIDNDEKHELILYGFYLDETYWIYAFDEGLQLIDGWPHEIGLDDFVVPTMPVFGDLDGDGVPEYVSTFFDIDAGYVLAWNLDGSSFISGTQTGFFAVTPKPSVLNMVLLADINGDNSTDIIACANNDLFNTYKAQRIYAWNNKAEILPGFPMVTVQNAFNSDRITPSVGDIDNDGNIELIMPVPDSNQIYINYPYPYSRCQSPAPFWRYNRKMNNVAALDCQSTGVENFEVKTLPDRFVLSQNYPNPFNPNTTINYSIPSRSKVTISVYNLLGRKIRTLVNENTKTAGSHQVVWDGRDERGYAVGSGIYFYRIKAGDFSDSRKMILLK